MNADVPHVQVTMIGNTGSGKTTYLIGMYAEMSVGINNYFLTSDQDTHVDLTSAWSALIEEGLLPKGTEDSKSFQFMFRYGMTPLLSLEWIDYRGGAVRGKSDDPDTVGLLNRLGESDSLYLTLDGALLASVLAGERNAERRLREATAQYNNMLTTVSDQRKAENLIPPSVVLLVTKSDLLIDHLDGDPDERRRTLVDWISARFAQIIEPDRDVAVCIVSLGEIGDEPAGRVDTQLVDPVRIHKPMVFTLFSYYRRAAMLFDALEARENEARMRHAMELQMVAEPGLNRLLGRNRSRELEARVGESTARRATFQELAGECWDRARVLERELLDVDTFIGGQRLGAA